MNAALLECTPAAAALIRRLKALHESELMFHQSGGCCDGSAPMCYVLGEFKVGQHDVLLGEIEGCPLYMGGAQQALWSQTRLVIDVVQGRGSGFSLEAPLGLRFITRSVFIGEAHASSVEGDVSSAGSMDED